MIWILVPILPIFASLITGFTNRGSRYSGIIFSIVSIPAIGLGIFEYPGMKLEWLLLGTEFSLDEPRRIILLLTGILWSISGLFAGSYLKEDSRKNTFFFFYGLAMAGNFGLLVAGDIIGFYTFFSLMSFSSYGLVIHNRSQKAIQAGKIYLVMAILGELFLISALFLTVQSTESLLLADIPPALAIADNGSFIFILALVGFGVKAGAIPLYFWLPLAHPAAPAPASAVLSGAMIKAGLVGWIHFAPIGLVDWEGLSLLMVSLGFSAALGALIPGLFQVDPKTNLAYSSISQMGILTAFLGFGLTGKIPSNTLLPAIALYAFNHGVAKGLLFLGTVLPAKLKGRWRILMWFGLGFGVLSIAGSPFTGGLWTKYSFKIFLEKSQLPGGEILGVFAYLSSMGTFLLLARFLYLLARIQPPSEYDHQKNDQTSRTVKPFVKTSVPVFFLPWLILLFMGGWWTIPSVFVSPEWIEFLIKDDNLLNFYINFSVRKDASFPILISLGIFIVFLSFPFSIFEKQSRNVSLIPPGDFLHVVVFILKYFKSFIQKRIDILRSRTDKLYNPEKLLYKFLDNERTIGFSLLVETFLKRWEVVGLFFLAFFFSLLFALQ